MYVSDLDRPWLETPFLFQGFYIRTESEIEELRRYCDTVQIDIEQSDASLQNALAHKDAGRPGSRTATARLSLWRRIISLFSNRQ